MRTFVQEIRDAFSPPFRKDSHFPLHEIVAHVEEVEAIKGIIGDNYNYLTGLIAEKQALGQSFISTEDEEEHVKKIDIYLNHVAPGLADAKNKSFFKPYRVAKPKTVSLDEKVDIDQLLNSGEGQNLEYKSSLRWNNYSKQADKELEYEVAIALNAFLNTDGGRLCIGVDDSGEVIGLEPDYQTLGNKNKDGFLLKIVELTDAYLGVGSHQYIKTVIVNKDGKEIAIITAEPSPEPVYLFKNGIEEFYIRVSSASQKLSISTIHGYIKKHWG
jgi:hypothetical protein